MATGVTVDVSGAVKKLQRVDDAFEPRKLLQLIGFAHQSWINKNFRDEGTVKKWRPLSRNTVAGRRKGSSSILQDTGRLRQSFVVDVRGSSSVSVGTRNRVAEFHQFGTRPYIIRPRRARALRFMTVGGPRFARSVRHPGLPARPMLPTKAVARKLAVDAVEGLLRKATRGAN